MPSSSPVLDSELLARFLRSRRLFGIDPPRVKPEAFIPHPYHDLSVTRHCGLTETQMWDAGQEVVREISVTEGRSITLYGRGDVLTADVRSQRLDVTPDEPPQNHAVIVGWPIGGKAEQKIIALELARKARLVLSPATPIPAAELQ